MHIGSSVSGKIKEEYDALDAIEAVLPAGTLCRSAEDPGLSADRRTGEQQTGHLWRRRRLY